LFFFFRSLERERERERERAKGEHKGGRGAETQKNSLFFFFFFSLFLPKREEIQKKKIERRVLSRARRAPVKNTKKQAKKARTSDPPLREREMKERRNAPVITLHTHNNTRFHHGTQTNLETVHLQNDRVRAFIKPSERCANVQHRHRGVEIRELARVVRSYKLVLPIISVLGELPFVVFGNTFFCFLSLASVFLSLCNISYAHRVNESEGDEFGRWKREREREREKRANAREVHSSSR
jgi:hypothetical protein